MRSNESSVCLAHAASMGPRTSPASARKSAVALISAALCAATAARGAEDRPAIATLPRTTVTATRIEEIVDAVPATVSVIDARQIEDELATDIKDLVRFEPGVTVRNSPARFTAAGSSLGRDGNSGFNIRGLEGNRVLMLVDGVRIPDAYSFGAQSVGRGDYVDLDALRSVEILRGPASALYGSDGLAGAVSFTTKDPGHFISSDEGWALRTRLSYASADDSSAAGLTGAWLDGPWQALLSYTRRDGSEQDNRGTNDSRNVTRTAPNPTDFASDAVLGKVVFAPSGAHRLRLTLERLDRESDFDVLSAVAVAPLAPTSVLALAARDEVKRELVSVDHRYQGENPWLTSARTALYHQNSRTREYSFEDRNTAADRVRDNTFDNEVTGFSTQLTSVLSVGDVAHELVYGIDLSQTRQEALRDGAIPPAGETFPTRAFPTTDHVLAGAYVQDEIGLFGERLTLYPALRYDYYSIEPKSDRLFTANVPRSQHDTHLTPKFGAVWSIAETLSLFANYGMGFKAPSPSQVNNGFANPIANYRSESNPDLKPETSETVEAGVRWRSGSVSWSFAAFSGRYRDFIEQIQVGGSFTPRDPAVFRFVNRGRVEIEGAELEAQADLGGGFSVQTAAAYARGTSTTRGVDAPLNSGDPWKVVAGLTWRDAASRYGGRLIATHSAGKEAARVDQSLCSAPACFRPSGFTIVDATAWVDVTDALTLRVGIFNLTDEKYWWWSDVRGQSSTSGVLDAFTQPGRNFSASLTWSVSNR